MKKIIAAALIMASAVSQTAVFAEGGAEPSGGAGPSGGTGPSGGNGSSGGTISTDIYSGKWITVSDWALDYVNAYRDTGLMPLYLKNYEVTDYTKDITRLQFCELVEPILNDKGYLDKDSYTASFSDCDSYATTVLSDLGIISGTSDTTFEPDRSITREEAAVILSRILEYTGAYHYEITDSIYHYRDEREFSDWAEEPIYAVYNAKLMGGTGGNNFSPKDKYTIEMAIKTMYTLYGMLPEKTKKYRSADDDSVMLPENEDFVLNHWSNGYYEIQINDTVYISPSHSADDSVIEFNAEKCGDMYCNTHDGAPYLAVNQSGGVAKIYNLDTMDMFTIPYKVTAITEDYIIFEDISANEKIVYDVLDYTGGEILEAAYTMNELREAGYINASSSGGSIAVN